MKKKSLWSGAGWCGGEKKADIRGREKKEEDMQGQRDRKKMRPVGTTAHGGVESGGRQGTGKKKRWDGAYTGVQRERGRRSTTAIGASWGSKKQRREEGVDAQEQVGKQ